VYRAVSSEELQEVREDPQVKKIMTLFGGEVIDVRRDETAEQIVDEDAQDED